jgi:malonyl-CoA/methylmalonyl-CoA synthetase
MLFSDRIAIIDGSNSFTYSELLSTSANIASSLLNGQEEDLAGMPVAFIVPLGFDYVAIQWGIWRAGGIAVPLRIFYTPGRA